AGYRPCNLKRPSPAFPPRSCLNRRAPSGCSTLPWPCRSTVTAPCIKAVACVSYKAPNASKAAGGAKNTSNATTSSHKMHSMRAIGFIVSAPPWTRAGSCMAFSGNFMQPGTLPDYAELDCISNFSFLRGASHPEELVRHAAKLGYSALALADECSVAGVVRAYVESLEHNIHLIVGSRFRLDTDGPEDELHIIALARNDEGYANLAELITLARTRSTPKGQYQLSLQDILHPPQGLAHLRGLPGCAIIFKPAYGIQAEALRRQLQRLRHAFQDG